MRIILKTKKTFKHEIIRLNTASIKMKSYIANSIYRKSWPQDLNIKDLKL